MGDLLDHFLLCSILVSGRIRCSNLSVLPLIDPFRHHCFITLPISDFFYCLMEMEIDLLFQFIRSPSDRSIPLPLLHNFTHMGFLLLDGNGISGSDNCFVFVTFGRRWVCPGSNSYHSRRMELVVHFPLILFIFIYKL